MKRVLWKMLCVVCIGAVAVSLSGCGGGSDESTDETSDKESSTTTNSDVKVAEGTEPAASLAESANDAEQAVLEYLEASEELARMFALVTDATSAKQMGVRIREQSQLLNERSKRFEAIGDMDRAAAMNKYQRRWVALQQKMMTEGSRLAQDPVLAAMFGEAMKQPPMMGNQMPGASNRGGGPGR